MKLNKVFRLIPPKQSLLTNKIITDKKSCKKRFCIFRQFLFLTSCTKFCKVPGMTTSLDHPELEYYLSPLIQPYTQNHQLQKRKFHNYKNLQCNYEAGK